MFFAGLFVLAIGNIFIGIAAWRTEALPVSIAVFLAGAMPGGVVVGGALTVVTGQPIALASGVMIPFGLAVATVNGYVW
ncbi:hypothetical protein [Halorubrum vacuolatum]|uniref:hypothetical protein n=1 Tax=Halorubrum vacuolatum TaxID=63740 RepID=UPI000B79548B|nr:hypothetical protein [Halorubrum vacuolatum]